MPELVVRLSKDRDDRRPLLDWSSEWENTQVPIERVIAYWSRTLNSAETRYSATEREALAAKEALVRFQPLIEGEQILLVTDHSALTWSKTYENANRRLAGWGLVFAAFPEMIIVHRPGKLHSNVDPLSRLPRIPEFISPVRDDLPDPTASTEHKELEAVWLKFIEERERAADIYMAVITRAQRSKANKSSSTGVEDAESFPEADPQRNSELLEETPDAAPPELLESKEQERYRGDTSLHVFADPDVVARFNEGYKKDKDFSLLLNRTASEKYLEGKFRAYRVSDNGLLYFEDADRRVRLCVPATERSGILREAHDEAHETAHAGWERTLASLRERFYWPSLRKDVIDYVYTCDPCQKTKHDRGAKSGFLQPLEIPTRPFDTISLDFITGLPRERNLDAILVVVDKLTKFAHFIPTTEASSASDAAGLLFKRIVKTFGMPNTIVGDRDPRWTSKVWSALAELFKTRLALSTSRHPQTDGQTEVMNQHLETMLRAYIQADQKDWPNWLDVIQLAYNNAQHSSHKESPAKLLLGYKPRTPLDFLAEEGLKQTDGLPDLRKRVQLLASHREAARDAIKKSADRQAYQFDKGHLPPKYRVGDEVLINPHSLELVDVKGKSRKLVQRFIGPFEITEVRGPKSYRIRLPDTYPMHNVVSLEHMRKYNGSQDSSRPILANPRDSLRSSLEWEVDKIVGEKRSKGKLLYQVRWKGYGAEDDTWQTARDLRNAPEIIREWRTRA